jgi:hypothetical protein
MGGHPGGGSYPNEAAFSGRANTPPWVVLYFLNRALPVSGEGPVPSGNGEPQVVAARALSLILEANDVVFVAGGADPAVDGNAAMVRGGFERHGVQGAGFALMDAVVIGGAFSLWPRQYPVVGMERQEALTAASERQACPAGFQGIAGSLVQPVALVAHERDFAAPDFFGWPSSFGPAFPPRRAFTASTRDRARR